MIEATDVALLYGWASDEQWSTSLVREVMSNSLHDLGFTSSEAAAYVNALATRIGYELRSRPDGQTDGDTS